MIRKIENDDFISGYITEEINDDYNQEIADKFAKDIEGFLLYFVDKAELITEDFVSRNCLRQHFSKHCIGCHTDRHSTRNRILYDFTDNSQYSDYEKLITSELRTSKCLTIDSFYDYERIMKYLQKLFCGNVIVEFSRLCGLRNNGVISIALKAFSSDITTNYRGGNTVDICIKNARGDTIALYPVDAHDVQTRINNTIANYTDFTDVGPFIFNND